MALMPMFWGREDMVGGGEDCGFGRMAGSFWRFLAVACDL